MKVSLSCGLLCLMVCATSVPGTAANDKKTYREWHEMTKMELRDWIYGLFDAKIEPFDKTINKNVANVEENEASIKQPGYTIKTLTKSLEEAKEAIEEIRATIGDAKTTVDTFQQKIDEQNAAIAKLVRHTMMLQFSVEERTRANGDSGVKAVRGLEKGPQNYYETGFFGPNINMIHDHSDYERTVGMGEVIAVLNGVEFKTRHNDYQLKMASTTSSELNAVEDIPFPPVPPEVLNAGGVKEQCAEMKQWFKAFATQDKTLRNYTDYFRANLCYLEATWMDDSMNFSDPFVSRRHAIEAASWWELHQKVRFTAYSGTKTRLENLATLPTTIMSVNETTGKPVYAQWSYTIKCAPIKGDLPTSWFRQMDDMSYRIPLKKSPADVKVSRGARFRLYEEQTDKFTRYSKMDEIFHSIPGKDNIVDPNAEHQFTFGEQMLDISSKTDKKLNTFKYHRFFKFDQAGAMGLQDVARGFNDANMWVAETKHEEVAPFPYDPCQGKTDKYKEKNEEACRIKETRVTYAIPMEIIYLTPLQSWNPYKLPTGTRKECAECPEENKGKREKCRRTGSQTDDKKAYLCINPDKMYYMTPAEFYKGKSKVGDSADSPRNAVGVFKDGEIKNVSASGIKIVMPKIEGIDGSIRLRYPISPLHGEGSAVWKELNALKHHVNEHMPSTNPNVIFKMQGSDPDHVDIIPHDHEVSISCQDFLKMRKATGDDDKNFMVDVESSFNQGHKHKLQIRYKPETKVYIFETCAGQKRSCPLDGHSARLSLLSNVDNLECVEDKDEEDDSDTSD